MQDGIVHITLFDGAARALVARSTDAVAEAARIHQASPTAAAALGRALTGTALLASMLKNEDDSISLSLSGGGPLGQVVCVGHADGDVKGYVSHPEVDPPRKREGKLDVGTAMGNDGFLTVIRDSGSGEPYVGRTALVSGEIAEDIASYLVHSEQTPSLMALGVTVRAGEVTGAGGLLVQPLPFCPEDVLDRIEALSERYAEISKLAQEAKSPAQLALLCLEGIPYEILGERPLSFRCDCSRERIESVLLSLGEEEMRDMMARDHGAQVHCHFCNTAYNFTEEELARLLEEGMA